MQPKIEVWSLQTNNQLVGYQYQDQKNSDSSQITKTPLTLDSRSERDRADGFRTSFKFSYDKHTGIRSEVRASQKPKALDFENILRQLQSQNFSNDLQEDLLASIIVRLSRPALRILAESGSNYNFDVSDDDNHLELILALALYILDQEDMNELVERKKSREKKQLDENAIRIHALESKIETQLDLLEAIIEDYNGRDASRTPLSLSEVMLLNFAPSFKESENFFDRFEELFSRFSYLPGERGYQIVAFKLFVLASHLRTDIVVADMFDLRIVLSSFRHAVKGLETSEAGTLGIDLSEATQRNLKAAITKFVFTIEPLVINRKWWAGEGRAEQFNYIFPLFNVGDAFVGFMETTRENEDILAIKQTVQSHLPSILKWTDEFLAYPTEYVEFILGYQLYFYHALYQFLLTHQVPESFEKRIFPDDFENLESLERILLHFKSELPQDQNETIFEEWGQIKRTYSRYLKRIQSQILDAPADLARLATTRSEVRGDKSEMSEDDLNPFLDLVTHIQKESQSRQERQKYYISRGRYVYQLIVTQYLFRKAYPFKKLNDIHRAQMLLPIDSLWLPVNIESNIKGNYKSLWESGHVANILFFLIGYAYSHGGFDIIQDFLERQFDQKNLLILREDDRPVPVFDAADKVEIELLAPLLGYYPKAAKALGQVVLEREALSDEIIPFIQSTVIRDLVRNAIHRAKAKRKDLNNFSVIDHRFSFLGDAVLRLISGESIQEEQLSDSFKPQDLSRLLTLMNSNDFLELSLKYLLNRQESDIFFVQRATLFEAFVGLIFHEYGGLEGQGLAQARKFIFDTFIDGFDEIKHFQEEFPSINLRDFLAKHQIAAHQRSEVRGRESKRTELWTEESGKIYVGNSRWITPASGYSDHTKILLEYLQSSKILNPKKTYFLDVGSSDGVILVGVSDMVKKGFGTEIDKKALAAARENLKQNKIMNTELHHGDLIDPVRGLKFDVIVSNPASMPLNQSQRDNFSRKSQHYMLANSGGDDGREMTERIIREAIPLLKNRGRLLVVHHHFIDLDKTKQLVESLGFQMKVVSQRKVLAKEGTAFHTLRSDFEAAHGISYFQEEGKVYYKLYLIEITRPKKRSEVRGATIPFTVNEQSMVTVARETTNRIARIEQVASLWNQLFPEAIAAEADDYQFDQKKENAILQSIILRQRQSSSLRGVENDEVISAEIATPSGTLTARNDSKANLLIPARLFSKARSAVRHQYIEAMATLYHQQPFGRIHLAGDNGALKSSFYGEDLEGMDASLRGLVGKIFKIDRQSSDVVVGRLQNQTNPFAASFDQRKFSELELSEKVMAFLVDVDGLHQMSPQKQLHYLLRVTEFLLLAAQLTDEEVNQLLQKMGIDTGKNPILSAEALLADHVAEVFRQQAAFAQAA